VPSRSPLKPVRPSRESRTEYEGLDPPSGHSVVTEPPLQGNSAGTGGPTSPAVKTIAPASRLVARIPPLVAFGLGLRNLAAGPASTTVLQFRPSARNPNNSSQPPRFAGVRGRCRPWIAAEPCKNLPSAAPLVAIQLCSASTPRWLTGALGALTLLLSKQRRSSCGPPGVAALGLRPYALGRQRGGHLHSSHDATCPRPVERRALRG
jgi:hypothetical protein